MGGTCLAAGNRTSTGRDGVPRRIRRTLRHQAAERPWHQTAKPSARAAHSRQPASRTGARPSWPAPRPSSATGPGIDPNEKLTVGELCAELKVSRSTFYDWRQKRRGPRCIRLPNGGLRIRRRDLDAWLATQEVA